MANMHLSDPQVNAKGAKFAPLLVEGQKLTKTFGSQQAPLRTQWGPSSLDNSESGRKNFDLLCDEGMISYLGELDSWARKYIQEHSQRILGKQMSAEQVQDSYRPLLQQRGSYPANLRCKINLTGTRKTRLWGADGSEREPPQSWQGAMYAAKVEFSHLYLMGQRDCGIVVNITDLQVFDQPAECPFN